MSRPIEDYAFIGNMVTGALVDRHGCIDWLCLPRFDSEACFAALLGTEENGCWDICPVGDGWTSKRRYIPGTPILETTFEGPEGAFQLIDFLPFSEDGMHVDVVRLVRGLRGRVKACTKFVLRFGYGRMVPWVRGREWGIHAVAGPDAVDLRSPVRLEGRGLTTCSEFEVHEGQDLPFILSYYPSHRQPHQPPDVHEELRRTTEWWQRWSGHCRYRHSRHPDWTEAVRRSLVTLKTLTFQPTGGIVAAATTSLPEEIGGVRNWDYRYCWIRDAALTLYALLTSGYREEAHSWREWLLRATAGKPEQLQIMYGIAGERLLHEFELPWLPGYEGSSPVRIGNGAFDQLQIDVFGELMDALHVGRKFDLEAYDDAWQFQKVLMEHLEGLWDRPDEGIWEVRGGKRHFTHSRLMAWVAYDRAVKAVERFGLSGPAERWKKMRDIVHEDICRNAWNDEKGAFVQFYGGRNLDASLLLMPEVGFLPPDDPRIRGTVEAIERELMEDGFVHRYNAAETPDGLPGSEGVFLACSFWMADAMVMLGRVDDARDLFERLLDVRNDVGLLAEEYDPKARRQLGNFPQAFSHIALVNTANNLLSVAHGPAEQRADRAEREEPSEEEEGA